MKCALMPDTAEGRSRAVEQARSPSNTHFEARPLLPMFDCTDDKAPKVPELRADVGSIFIVTRLYEPLSGANAYYPWISGPNPDDLGCY